MSQYSLDANFKGNAPTKATFRQVLRSSLANKGVADELIDAIVSLMDSYDALLAELDTEATLTGHGHYVSTFAVDPIDPDSAR